MIYLDYAATTPLDAQILEKMMPYLTTDFGNASSVHGYGRDALMAIERSRNKIAAALGVSQGEILFTGSASEANNLAIKGIVEKASQIIRDQGLALIPELVVSCVEHPCVMEAARHVERLGWAKVVWLPVTQSGHVRIEDVKLAINERTVLVSVMYVNNEVGSVQPVSEISHCVKAERRRRDSVAETQSLPIWFHTDVVQAVQYFPCSPTVVGADLMTFAAHKCYGPKGVGILYKSAKVSVVRQVDGGGQEYYLRAGTENVANMVGASEAMIRAVARASDGRDAQSLYDLKQVFVKNLKDQTHVTSYMIVGDSEEFSPMTPHILSLLVKDCDAEALIVALDREGFALSSGSACSSGVVKKSHVIEALHVGWETYAPVRISLGNATTAAQLSKLAVQLPLVVEKIRSLHL